MQVSVNGDKKNITKVSEDGAPIPRMWLYRRTMRGHDFEKGAVFDIPISGGMISFVLFRSEYLLV